MIDTQELHNISLCHRMVNSIRNTYQRYRKNFDELVTIIDPEVAYLKPLATFRETDIRLVFTDIDGTLTARGQLPADAYSALCRLADNNIMVVPVTGRPAGWCEMIARLWPVHGVIGENGGFYFSYRQGKMNRHFAVSEFERLRYQTKLEIIRDEILANIPGAALSSDQFCRLFDLAIDFCEDVRPLSNDDRQKIVSIFTKHGAQAKISSIHVNGWFGDYDKLTMCKKFIQKELKEDPLLFTKHCAFIGDSPNDEPMFAYFPHSFGVANVREFSTHMKHLPMYVSIEREGAGFTEIAHHFLRHM